jgi:hypothetical protein
MSVDATFVDSLGWPVEAAVVVHAAQTTVGDPERLRSLATATADWDRVVDYARTHGVVSLVASSLTEHCRDLVPERLLDTLRVERQDIAKRNLGMTQELCQVLGNLENEGFDVLPYRGPVLAADAYGDVASRQFGDIDLLVRREEIPALKRFLERRGYEAQYQRAGTEELSSGQEWAYTHYRRDYPFVDATNGTVIELHWRVLDRRFPTAIELDTVWDRRETTSVAGTDLPIFGPEDRLLMLCVHGTRHYWERLEWICDVAELLQSATVDWAAALSRAQSFDAGRMFLLGPALVHRLYGVDLSDEILTAIKADPAIDDLVDTALGRLFDDEMPGQVALQRFQASSLERYRDKAYLLAWWLFVPTRNEIELVALPRLASFLYYAVRPLRLSLLPLLRRLRCPETSNR